MPWTRAAAARKEQERTGKSRQERQEGAVEITLLGRKRGAPAVAIRCT